MKTSTTHKEKYYHFRDQSRAPAKLDGITVYLREDEPGMWSGAAALCVKPDQFSRKTGRQVARRKYFQGKSLLPLDPDAPTCFERAAQIAEQAYYQWESARRSRGERT